jgi:hypothetical protein
MMTLPSLPTDNLYKFLALSGVALYALSLFGPHAKIEEASRRTREVNRTARTLLVEEQHLGVKLERLVQEGEKLQREIRAVSDQQGVVAASLREVNSGLEATTRAAAAAKELTGALEAATLAVVDAVRSGDPAAVAEACAAREAARVALVKYNESTASTYVQSHEAIEAARALHAKMTARQSSIPPLLDRIQRGIDEAEELRQLQRRKAIELDSALDEARDLLTSTGQHLNLARIGFGMSAVLMVCGFAGWYFKVQKLQDRLLLAQVGEMEKARTASKPSESS